MEVLGVPSRCLGHRLKGRATCSGFPFATFCLLGDDNGGSRHLGCRDGSSMLRMVALNTLPECLNDLGGWSHLSFLDSHLPL